MSDLPGIPYQWFSSKSKKAERIKRRITEGVIIKVYVYFVFLPSPATYFPDPSLELRVAVARGVGEGMPMQADVHHVGSDGVPQRPVSGVRLAHGDAVSAQAVGHLGVEQEGSRNSMAWRTVRQRFSARAKFSSRAMCFGNFAGSCHRTAESFGASAEARSRSTRITWSGSASLRLCVR